MTTVALTNTPIQVSTGVKAVHLQVKKGSKPYYAISASSPSKSDFYVLEDKVMNIGEGFSVWMWNPSSYPVEVTFGAAT